MAGEAAAAEFDVFISYRRTDVAFAAGLEKALGAYSPPRGLGLPSARLKVFRDESDIFGPEYYAAIDELLRKSRKLVVVCSPAARASKYVNDEITRFAKARGAANILSVIVAGQPNNETVDETLRAFPDALCEALTLPLATSYLGFDSGQHRVDRGAFRSAWYTLLAGIFEVGRAAIEERDHKRIQRRRRIISAVTASVVAALTVLTIWALIERWEAERQSEIALSQQLAAQSQLERVQQPALLERSLLLAIHAMKRLDAAGERSLEVDQALREAMRLLPLLAARIPYPSAAEQIVLSGDGRQLTVLAGDGVRVWNLEDGTSTTRWTPEERAPLSKLLTEQVLVIGTESGAVMREVRTGELVWRVPHSMVQALAIDAEGRHLATASWGSNRGGARGDNTVRVWSVAGPDRRQIAALENTGQVTALALSADAQLLAAGTRDSLRVWRLRSDGADLTAALGHGGAAVALSPNGRLVAAADDNEVRVWSLDANTPEVARLPHAGVEALAFAVDGRMLATAASDRTARVWDLTTIGREGAGPIERARMPHRARVNDVIFGQQTGILLTASGERLQDDDAVRVWQIPDPRREYLAAIDFGGRAAADAMRLTQFARGELDTAAADGERLTASRDGDHAVLVSAADGTIVRRIEHEEPVSDFDLSADGRVLATASRTTAYVWDLATEEALQAIAHTRDVFQLALSPDGARLVTATRVGSLTMDDRVAWIWDASTGDMIAPLEHAARVIAVDFSRDDMVATVAAGSAWVWTAAGTLIQTIGRDLGLSSVALNPASALVATGGADGMARLWEIDGAREVARLPHAFAVIGVGFSPDSRFLITASYAQAFTGFPDRREVVPRVWPLDPSFLIEEACTRLTRELDQGEVAQYLGARDRGDAACSTVRRPAESLPLTETGVHQP